MDTALIVLEYVKVFLSGPVMMAVVSITFLVLFRPAIAELIAKIVSIKLPGGSEISASQQVAVAKEKRLPDELPTPRPEVPNLPAGVDADVAEVARQLIQAEQARAYLWEYRYLNFFLVANTQRVLEWFSSLSDPTTYAAYDTMWSSAIPDANERQAIIRALESHYLILRTGDLLQISEKGKEYLEWRGKVITGPVA